MRKLPRRLPSNSPSLAWVAFAVLLLAVGGGLAGLYTHRQNQEASKLRLITELKKEVGALNQRREELERQFDSRSKAVQLKLALKEHDLNLVPIVPENRVLMPTTTPSERGPRRELPSTAPSATGASAPSVMAVVGRP
jgi:hypothetical protein